MLTIDSIRRFRLLLLLLGALDAQSFNRWPSLSVFVTIVASQIVVVVTTALE